MTGSLHFPTVKNVVFAVMPLLGGKSTTDSLSTLQRHTETTHASTKPYFVVLGWSTFLESGRFCQEYRRSLQNTASF